MQIHLRESTCLINTSFSKFLWPYQYNHFMLYDVTIKKSSGRTDNQILLGFLVMTWLYIQDRNILTNILMQKFNGERGYSNILNLDSTMDFLKTDEFKKPDLKYVFKHFKT